MIAKSYSKKPSRKPVEIERPVTHFKILSETCLAMLENVALQVAETCCWENFELCYRAFNTHNAIYSLSSLDVVYTSYRIAALKIRGQRTLQEKLLEGWYTVQWCCQLLQSLAKSRAGFYFVQRFAQQQKIARQPILHFAILRQLVSQQDCARQVVEKIAECNRALDSCNGVANTTRNSNIRSQRTSFSFPPAVASAFYLATLNSLSWISSSPQSNNWKRT